jgi:hypothetical protein
MATFDLFLDGSTFTVPTASLHELFAHQQSPNATGYAVQAPIPVAVFHTVVQSLENNARLFCLP